MSKSSKLFLELQEAAVNQKKTTDAEKVTSCEHLLQLAYAKKSIYVSIWARHTSAAFLIGWPAGMLIQWIKRGRLTIYTPAPKNKKPWYTKPAKDTTKPKLDGNNVH